jgi:hypothetical protein
VTKAELIDGETVIITDDRHPLHGFVGEAQVLESGHEVLVYIDEKRDATVGIGDVEIFWVK